MMAPAEPATAREEQATTVARKARELLELVHDIDLNASVQIGFNRKRKERE